MSKSKKTAAMKLQEQIAKSKDLPGLLNELATESDRAAAIVAAAFLDENIRQFLTNYFVDDPKEVRDLLSNERPLGAFGARIRILYCLGLIPRNDFDALLIIKNIRNEFAHQLHGRSFDDVDIADLCKKLYALTPFDPSTPITPRKMYLMSSLLIFTSIQGDSSKIKEKRCKQWVERLIPEGMTLEPTIQTTAHDGSVVRL